jgi:hypothetical protein
MVAVQFFPLPLAFHFPPQSFAVWLRPSLVSIFAISLPFPWPAPPFRGPCHHRRAATPAGPHGRATGHRLHCCGDPPRTRGGRSVPGCPPWPRCPAGPGIGWPVSLPCSSGLGRGAGARGEKVGKLRQSFANSPERKSLIFCTNRFVISSGSFLQSARGGTLWASCRAWGCWPHRPLHHVGQGHTQAH